MSKSDPVDLLLQIHAETARAILVSDTGEEEDAVWIPLSQVVFDELGDGEVMITMPEWLALDKGLI